MFKKSSALRLAGTVAVLAVTFLVGRWSVSRSQFSGGADFGGQRPGAKTGGAQATGTSAESGGTAADVAARARLAPQSLAADDERQKNLEQWAQRDPQAALEFARTKLKGDRRAQALSAILTVWGKNDPAAAWAWVSANEPTASHHFDALLEVFGKNSPETAAHYVAEVVRNHPEAALEVNLSALLGITYSGNFAAAQAFVNANAGLSPELRGNLYNFIAGQWARYSPEAAAAWVVALPAGPQRDQALVGLGDSWAGTDPAGAAKFAETLPSGESRQLALRQAINNWLQDDPDKARQWVMDNNHHEDYDQAVAAIATQSNFMFREPDRALRWASTIFDDGIRIQSTGVVLAGLYSRDPAATVAYIRGATNLTDEQRNQLLTQFPPKE